MTNAEISPDVELSPKDLFHLGEEVARRGEVLPTEYTGLAENFSYRGLLPDGSKVRIRYAKNSKFTHDDTWLKRQDERSSSDRNIEHVYIEGKDLYTAMYRADKVYGGTLRTEETFGMHTEFNDRNVSMEELLRSVRPDTSPVQETPRLSGKVSGEKIFSLTKPDRYGYQDTGIRVHATSIEDAEERYIEANAQIENYDAIRSLRTHGTWFEQGGLIYDDRDWYR